MDPTSIGLLVAEGSALAAIAAAYSLGRPQSKDSTSTPAPVSSVAQAVPITSAVQSEPTATAAPPTAVPATVPAPPTATAAPPTAVPATVPVSRTLTPELEQAITTVFRTQSTFKPTIEPANLARRLFIGDSVEPRQFEFAFHPDRCDPGSVIQLNNEYSKTLCDFMFTSAERVDGNYKFKDLENTRTEFIKIVPTITATPATPALLDTVAEPTTAPPTVTTDTPALLDTVAEPTVTTDTPALLDTVAEPTTAQPSSPINAPGFDESISFPEPEQTLNLASTPTDTLEIPPELHAKLNAAREKFETLRLKVVTEENNPQSTFAKSTRKETRSEAARKAAVTREKNKVIAQRDSFIQKEALEIKRKTANEARDERARKRAGIVSDPATVESILQTTEDSTNEVVESLKALEQERPTSASQDWFMDIENELQMYFDYYNQVERDLADVPPAQSVSIPTLPSISKEQKESLQLKKLTPSRAVNYGTNKTNQRFPVRKGGTPRKHKKTKTRKLTFRRTRKH